MLTPRRDVFHHLLLISMCIIMTLRFSHVEGRTWPRFVSMRSYDTDKIYSTSLPSPKNGTGRKSSFSSEINLTSQSPLHFDDMGDYSKHYSGRSSEGTNSTSGAGETVEIVESTYITGPFEKGKDVNTSVYNLLCPSEPSKNKYPIRGMCRHFVTCGTGDSFQIHGCSRTECFNETVGQCETPKTSSCEGQEESFKNMSSHDILHVVLKAVQGNERKSKSIPGDVTALQSITETGEIETTQNKNSSSPSTDLQSSLNSKKSVNEEIEDLCKNGSTSTHGLHAHPELCNKYIQCGASPGTFFIKTCGPGTVFNVKTMTCDWASNVDGCEENGQHLQANQLRRKKRTPTRTISCEVSGANREVIIPDPDDCASYHICSSAGNVYTTRKCNDGTLFNPLTSVCDFADNVDCSSRKNDFGTYACSTTDKYIAPHPDACNKFVECDHGVLAVKACPPGTLYEREKEKCDHASRVTCRKPISLHHDIDINFIHKRKRRNVSGAGPTSRLNLACEFNYIAPHPHNCHQFVECEDRRIYIKNCGPGTAFNPNLGQCDWPYNIRQSDPDDCTTYRQCVTTHYERRACLPEQYFDQELNRCIDGDPYWINQCRRRDTPRPTRRTTTTTTEYPDYSDVFIPPPS